MPLYEKLIQIAALQKGSVTPNFRTLPFLLIWIRNVIDINYQDRLVHYEIANFWLDLELKLDFEISPYTPAFVISIPSTNALLYVGKLLRQAPIVTVVE